MALILKWSTILDSRAGGETIGLWGGRAIVPDTRITEWLTTANCLQSGTLSSCPQIVKEDMLPKLRISPWQWLLHNKYTIALSKIRSRVHRSVSFSVKNFPHCAGSVLLVRIRQCGSFLFPLLLMTSNSSLVFSRSKITMADFVDDETGWLYQPIDNRCDTVFLSCFREFFIKLCEGQKVCLDAELTAPMTKCLQIPVRRCMPTAKTVHLFWIDGACKRRYVGPSEPEILDPVFRAFRYRRLHSSQTSIYLA